METQELFKRNRNNGKRKNTHDGRFGRRVLPCGGNGREGRDMLTAAVIGRIASDVRMETAGGREYMAFEVEHMERGVTVPVTCRILLCGWSRPFMRSLVRGVRIYVTGHYRDSAGVGKDGSPEVRRLIRSVTFHVMPERRDGR